jgi:hypothetical protein
VCLCVVYAPIMCDVGLPATAKEKASFLHDFAHTKKLVIEQKENVNLFYDLFQPMHEKTCVCVLFCDGARS